MSEKTIDDIEIIIERNFRRYLFEKRKLAVDVLNNTEDVALRKKYDETSGKVDALGDLSMIAFNSNLWEKIGNESCL